MATPDNHTRAERLKPQYTAANQNITSSRSSNESEPFVSLIDFGVRHVSNDILEVRYVALVPQLELLGNDGIRGRPDTVLAGGTWFIKKFRPTLITAFLGDRRIRGDLMTTFSGTKSNALPRKYIASDSFGERRLLLRDHVQLIADHHPSGAFVPKVPQCYNDGETQLHWNGLKSLAPPSEQVCYVSLLETSTYAIGNDGIIPLGSLSKESWNDFIAMRNARRSTYFQELEPSLKRKRDASDDSVSTDDQRQIST